MVLFVFLKPICQTKFHRCDSSSCPRLRFKANAKCSRLYSATLGVCKRLQFYQVIFDYISSVYDFKIFVFGVFFLEIILHLCLFEMLHTIAALFIIYQIRSFNHLKNVP